MSKYAPGELRWFGHILSPDFKQLRLIIVSDSHYGNPLYSEKYFMRTIEFIRKNEDAYAILNGDLLESVIKTSKGDVYNQTLTPSKQRKNMTEILEPIKDKILGMTTGNHENRLAETTSEDPSELIATALGVPYRPEGILLKISLGRGNERHKDQPYVFWGYTTHGYGGARTKAAKAIKVERTSTFVHSDFTAMSHDHVVNVAPDVYFMPDMRGLLDKKTGFITGAISAHRKMLIKTNAYLKWGGYSEFLGFPPVDMTTPVIMLLTPDSDFWGGVPDKPKRAIKVVV